MALKSWLASLKKDVSGVSGVHAPVHAGLGRYVTDMADVSGVSASGSGGMVASDTADTAAQNQTYQAQPAWALGCTADTGDTWQKINVNIQTTDTAATSTRSEQQRVVRQCGPWLSESESVASKVYDEHHFKCHQCIAASRGDRYGSRCGMGLALWNDYTGTTELQTSGGHSG